MSPAFVAGTVLGLLHIALLHGASARRRRATTVIALSSAWTLVHRRRVRGLPVRPAVATDAAGRSAGAPAASRCAPATTARRCGTRSPTALGDPTTQLLFRDPGSRTWHDARGAPVGRAARPRRGRAVTAIATSGHDVALIHDVALLDDPRAAGRCQRHGPRRLRHEQLTADLSAALSDLEDSRRRIAEAADIERARIERDLHDGAQQRLIALRIRLGLAEELLTTDPSAAVREVHQLGFEAERALEELRSLADGVYPPLLTDRGLQRRAALRRRAGPAAGPRRRGRRHPPPGRDRERHLLHVRRGAAERAQARRGRHRRLDQARQTRDRLNFEISDDGAGFTRRRPATDAGCATCMTASRPSAATSPSTPRPGRGTRVVGSFAASSGPDDVSATRERRTFGP